MVPDIKVLLVWGTGSRNEDTDQGVPARDDSCNHASLRELRKRLTGRRHSARVKPWGLFKDKEEQEDAGLPQEKNLYPVDITTCHPGLKLYRHLSIKLHCNFLRVE